MMTKLRPHRSTRVSLGAVAGVLLATSLVACANNPAPAGKASTLTTLGGGHGSVADGQRVYSQNCAVCHGDQLDGNGGKFPPLIGRQTVPDHPSAVELYTYVRRTMPFSNPGSLTDDQYYSAVAYLLGKNGLLPDNATLDARSITAVALPGGDKIAPSLPGAPEATQQVTRGSSEANPITTPAAGH